MTAISEGRENGGDYLVLDKLCSTPLRLCGRICWQKLTTRERITWYRQNSSLTLRKRMRCTLVEKELSGEKERKQEKLLILFPILNAWKRADVIFVTK